MMNRFLKSDDPKVFTDENLEQYNALIFSNSNNEAFENNAQRDAFRRYIRGGGGFVGIHSAWGSERTWPYIMDYARFKILSPAALEIALFKANQPSFFNRSKFLQKSKMGERLKKPDCYSAGTMPETPERPEP